MSVKLTLLKSNEMVISDLKEIRKEDKIVAYLLNKPHMVFMQGQKEVFLTESDNHNSDNEVERPVQVTMTPWVYLTSDENILITNDWIVTIMEPLEPIVKMYEEKVNGKSN